MEHVAVEEAAQLHTQLVRAQLHRCVLAHDGAVLALGLEALHAADAHSHVHSEMERNRNRNRKLRGTLSTTLAQGGGAE